MVANFFGYTCIKARLFVYLDYYRKLRVGKQLSMSCTVFLVVLQPVQDSGINLPTCTCTCTCGMYELYVNAD